MALQDVLYDLSHLWKIWSIQGFMILSLTMQLVLALAAPLRKKTSNPAVILIVWLAYLLADWTAVFTFGLISNAKCRNFSSDLDGTEDLLALWASFLLIHLGGPDTITAFALEDNALWFRHLIGLIAQLFAFLFIYVKTQPNQTLLAPTLLVLATGIIKYGERTRALYLASLKTIKDVYLGEVGSERADVQIFMGLIVNIMPNYSQWLKSREFLQNMDAELAFKKIKMELNLLYDSFYTKIIAAYTSWGVNIRNFAYYMSIAALVLFFVEKKGQLKTFDVIITYALLGGVIALDTTSEVMLGMYYLSSKKWSNLIKRIIGRCIIPFLMTALMYAIVIRLLCICGCQSIVERSWSSKMSSFNLLDYSFKESHTRKRYTFSPCYRAISGCINQTTGVKLRNIKDKIDKMRYTKTISMDVRIWNITFNILHRRALSAIEADQVKKIYEARGELALQYTSSELKRYVTEFEFDHSVLLWHVATEICYNTDTNLQKENENVKFSKILSDYMMYLMVDQPDMMSPVADIFHKRYRDTCHELKQVMSKTFVEFCSTVSERYSVASEPVHKDGKLGACILVDSCSLAKILGETEQKWEIIFMVWVELLFYAAGHCRAVSHAQLVSKGGEFISLVWLLMAQFGIVPRFPKY